MAEWQKTYKNIDLFLKKTGISHEDIKLSDEHLPTVYYHSSKYMDTESDIWDTIGHCDIDGKVKVFEDNMNNFVKIITGIPALKEIQEYYSEEYFGYSFKELEKFLRDDQVSVSLEVLLSDGVIVDFRIWDPYQYLKSDMPLYRNSNGWTHWQFESEEASELYSNCFR
jgi:hypothetical protein